MGIKKRIRQAKAVAYASKTLRNKRHRNPDLNTRVDLPQWEGAKTLPQKYKGLGFALNPNRLELIPGVADSVPAKAEARRLLEAKAAVGKEKYKKVLSVHDRVVIEKMVEKFGEDFVAMKMSRLNKFFWTEAQIKKFVETYHLLKDKK